MNVSYNHIFAILMISIEILFDIEHIFRNRYNNENKMATKLKNEAQIDETKGDEAKVESNVDKNSAKSFDQIVEDGSDDDVEAESNESRNLKVPNPLLTNKLTKRYQYNNESDDSSDDDSSGDEDPLTGIKRAMPNVLTMLASTNPKRRKVNN